MHSRLAAARLYSILDLGYVSRDRVDSVTRVLVEGGVDLIQLRAKDYSVAQLLPIAQSIRQLIPAEGPLFIVNDHPELALQSGADGLHLGQGDLPLAEARELTRSIPQLILGKSTHSLEQAVAGEREGADYIGVGPIFATPTKPDYTPVGPDLIGEVSRSVQVPQFCIGGINEENLSALLAAGARRVVIVSALLQSPNIVDYCTRVKRQLSSYSL